MYILKEGILRKFSKLSQLGERMIAVTDGFVQALPGLLESPLLFSEFFIDLLSTYNAIMASQFCRKMVGGDHSLRKAVVVLDQVVKAGVGKKDVEFVVRVCDKNLANLIIRFESNDDFERKVLTDMLTLVESFLKQKESEKCESVCIASAFMRGELFDFI